MPIKSFVKSEKFLKLFYPFAFLAFLALTPFLVFGMHEKFGVNLSAFQGVLFFLPQCLFPYDGYFRAGPVDEGAHQSLHPLGLPGWITSFAHWAVVFLIYYWFARRLNLGKSLLLFFFLGVASLILSHFLLGAFGWEFSLEGP